MRLKISHSLHLPGDVATARLGFLAQQGAGKSYAAMVLAEEFCRGGQPWVAIDPTDAWWGMRARADGKPSGFQVAILGGEHADLPLEPGAGAVVARFFLGSSQPIVLSLAEMRKAQMRRFVADFLDELYHGANGVPRHVFLDECDLFCPQLARRFGEDDILPRLIGACEDLVRRGRKKGIGVSMISQRPAVVHKDVLSQVDVMVVGRLVSPNDRKAVLEWVDINASREEAKGLLGDLPHYTTGDMLVWAPRLNIKGRYRIRQKESYDSSSTPKVGAKSVPLLGLQEIDLAGLRAAMADTVKRAEESDPKRLRARVAELERQLARPQPKAAPAQYVATPVVKPADLARIEKSVERLAVETKRLDDARDRLAQAQQVVVSELGNFRAAIREAAKLREPGEVSRRIDSLTVMKPQATGPSFSPALVAAAKSNGALPKGERAVLTAVAQYADGASRELVSVLTGYKRSTRDLYLQKLEKAGAVEAVQTLVGARMVATNAGRAMLGDGFEPLPTGEALRQHWLARLPLGERRVLEVVLERAGGCVHREVISQETDYKRSTRDLYLQKLVTRMLVKVSDDGAVAASQDLFS